MNEFGMEIKINTKFDIGQRVWMPDGNGWMIAGRVTGIKLYDVDFRQSSEKIISQSLNYHCIDIEGKEFVFHEYQLEKR